MTLTITQWQDTGLLPTMQVWHKYESGVSTNGACHDYSGNARHLVQGTTPPVLTANVLGTHSGWVFDGTNLPLANAATFTTKHIFVLGAFSGSVFPARYPTLLGCATGTSHPFVGSSGTSKFDITYINADTLYRKNDTSYVYTNMQAPFNNSVAALEMSSATGMVINGLQVGKFTTLATTEWSGPWVETLMFSSVLTAAQRRLVHLYLGIEFGYSTFSLPIYFPDAGTTGIPYEHFDEVPRDWSSVTISNTYEDDGRSFNVVSDNPAREWQLDFIGGLSNSQTLFYDAFYEMVRLNKTFSFIDKWGVTWTNVRVKSYSRSHSAHKSWDKKVSFRLVRYGA